MLNAAVDAFAEIVEQVVAGAHGDGDERHGGGFVGLTWKNAGVADAEVGDVVSLSPLVGDGSFWVVAEAAHAGLVQTPSGAIGFCVRTTFRRPWI